MFDETQFEMKLVENHISKKELASLLKINDSTLYRKIKRGGDFTREEINTMIRVLHIDNPNRIFFTEKLT